LSAQKPATRSQSDAASFCICCSPYWDSRGSWFQAPTIKGLVDIGVTIAATALTAPLGGIGGALLGAGVGLVDDAIFGLLDGTSGYKKWEEVGLDFGKKVASAAVNLAIGGAFNGFSAVPGSTEMGGLFGSMKGLASGLPTSGIGSVIGKTVLGGMQTMTTSLASSAINAFQWDGQGISWSGDAFGQGVQGGLISMASGMASTFVGGALNLGLEGFHGNLYGNGTALSNLVGGLAGQAVNYAAGGDFTLNLLNASNLSGGALNGGLLELSFGRNGISSRIGMGGADANLSNLLKSFKGLETWGVNIGMALSGQQEAGRYASALRSLYSAGGGSQERALYERILSGRTDVLENANADYGALTQAGANGYSTITLGSHALGDGSRFGLNILLAHEAYRDGVNNGADGQRQETNNAIVGHIQTAMGLGNTYGFDQLSGRYMDEIAAYENALKGDYNQFAQVLGNYESSEDYLLYDPTRNRLVGEDGDSLELRFAAAQLSSGAFVY